MRAAAAIALFLTFPELCVAQDNAPVAQPEVKVGDRWTYRRMDYSKNKPGEMYQIRVTFAERGAIHALVTRRDAPESDASYTSEWNTMVSPTGIVNTRERGMLQFPLKIGATYKIDWRLDNPARGVSAYHDRTVRVVGWEDIAVPAGRFRALRVEAKGTYHRLDRCILPGSALDVFWYVPEVKRWVKVLSEESSGQYYGNFAEELIEFNVQ